METGEDAGTGKGRAGRAPESPHYSGTNAVPQSALNNYELGHQGTRLPPRAPGCASAGVASSSIYGAGLAVRKGPNRWEGSEQGWVQRTPSCPRVLAGIVTEATVLEAKEGRVRAALSRRSREQSLPSEVVALLPCCRGRAARNAWQASQKGVFENSEVLSSDNPYKGSKPREGRSPGERDKLWGNITCNNTIKQFKEMTRSFPNPRGQSCGTEG